MPRALVDPTFLAVCPTSSAITTSSGALTAQSAAAADRSGNANATATETISSQAIGFVALFAMLSIRINLDARTNSPRRIGGIRRAPPHQLLFALVARQHCGRFECGPSFVVAAELL